MREVNYRQGMALVAILLCGLTVGLFEALLIAWLGVEGALGMTLVLLFILGSMFG